MRLLIGCTGTYHGSKVIQPSENWESSTSLNKKAKAHPWVKLRLFPFISGFQSKVTASATHQPTTPTCTSPPKSTIDAQAAWQECTSCLRQTDKNGTTPNKSPPVDPYRLSNALDSFGSRLAGSNKPLF